MTRIALPLCLLLLIMQATTAQGQTTGYSVPGENIVERGLPDEPLEQGELRFSVEPGYRDEFNNHAYAFPVGNAALGRAWAEGEDLKWQVAHSYSVVPVLVELEHRAASAQRIRVEVYSTHPYAREELQVLSPDSLDALSRQLAVFKGEYLVPPSVPTSFVLTPRYVPEAPPQSRVDLQVFVYFNDVLTHSQELDVVVMDPAHLYFLNLDGPVAPPDELLVNPLNELGLGLPGRDDLDSSVLTTMLYGLPVDRRVFTGAPLAARDFAFVCADARQVAGWPEDEQASLESYMLAGGRLCLYNAQGGWRGFTATAASPVGRGFLLPVAGDYQQARESMAGWVAGEIEEFILLAGGSARGYSLPGQAGNSLFGNLGVDLRRVYGRDALTGSLPSMRPGYLHPVWLYRELSSDNSVEPWDYPEYQLRNPRGSGSQSSRLALDNVIDSRQTSQAALLDAAVPRRPLPPVFTALLVLILLAMLLLPGAGRRVQSIAIAFLAAACIAGWWLAAPLDYRPVRLLLVDMDSRTEMASTRRLNVLLSGSGGSSELQMPPGALLRRVVWSPVGSFNQLSERSSSEFRGRGRSESVNLYVDAVETDMPEFPVQFELEQNGGRSRLLLDTSRLADGQACVLQTPLGFQLLEKSDRTVAITLSNSAIPVAPGLGRIRAIRDIHEGGSGAGNPHIARFGTMLGNLRDEVGETAAGSLAGICWQGVLRQPYGLLGVNQAQAVLLVVGNGPELDTGVEQVTVQRMCIPLGGLR